MAFLDALRDREQRFVAEVPVTCTGWVDPPRVTMRQRKSLGRPQKIPRLVQHAAPFFAVRDMLTEEPALRDQAWEAWRVKDGEKGPMVWEVKHLWFHPRGSDGLPKAGAHLLVARNVLEPEKLKFFVGHAPRETSVGVLLKVAFSRWRVERCFEDEKTELGFDHFEGHSYLGLMRHQIITAVTHLFLARTQQAWPEKNQEWTVCHIRTAAAALVQSWWLTGNAASRLLERTANIITNTQHRNAAARKSHRKRTIKRLHKLNITLQNLP